MAMDSFVGTFTKNTATGNQAITGVGFTPKVVIFFGSKNTATGFQPDFSQFLGWGISSTERYSNTVLGEDVNTTGKSLNRMDNDLCISYGIGTSKPMPLSDGADFVSQDVDGFTINWTTNAGNAEIISYIALGGADLINVKASHFFANQNTGNQAITGVGFVPDITFFGVEAKSTSYPADAGGKGGNFGAAISSTSRFGLSAIGGRPGRTNEGGAYLSNIRCLFGIKKAQQVEYEWDFVSHDTDGFTVNLINTKGSAVPVQYLCLKTTNGEVNITEILQPSAIGNQITTGIGFKPSTLIGFTRSEVSGTTGSVIGTLGIWATDGVNETSQNTGTLDNPGTTSIAKSHLSTTKIATAITVQATPTLDADANIVSLDTDGFTINWTTVDAIARAHMVISFGEASAGITTVQINSLSNLRILIPQQISLPSDLRIKVIDNQIFTTTNLRIYLQQQVTQSTNLRVKTTSQLTPSSNLIVRVINNSISLSSNLRVNLTAQIFKSSDLTIRVIGLQQSLTSNLRINVTQQQLLPTNLRINTQQQLFKSTNLRVNVNQQLFKPSDLRINVSQQTSLSSNLNIVLGSSTIQKSISTDLRILVIQQEFKSTNLLVVAQIQLIKSTDLIVKVSQQLNQSSDIRINVTQQIFKTSNLRIVVFSQLNLTSNLRVNVSQQIFKLTNLAIRVVNLQIDKTSNLRIVAPIQEFIVTNLRVLVSQQSFLSSNLVIRVVDNQKLLSTNLRINIQNQKSIISNLRLKIVGLQTSLSTNLAIRVIDQQISLVSNLNISTGAVTNQIFTSSDLRILITQQKFVSTNLRINVVQQQIISSNLRILVSSQITKTTNLAVRVLALQTLLNSNLRINSTQQNFLSTNLRINVFDQLFISTNLRINNTLQLVKGTNVAIRVIDNQKFVSTNLKITFGSFQKSLTSNLIVKITQQSLLLSNLRINVLANQKVISSNLRLLVSSQKTIPTNLRVKSIDIQLFKSSNLRIKIVGQQVNLSSNLSINLRYQLLLSSSLKIKVGQSIFLPSNLSVAGSQQITLSSNLYVKIPPLVTILVGDSDVDCVRKLMTQAGREAIVVRQDDILPVFLVSGSEYHLYTDFQDVMDVQHIRLVSDINHSGTNYLEGSIVHYKQGKIEIGQTLPVDTEEVMVTYATRDGLSDEDIQLNVDMAKVYLQTELWKGSINYSGSTTFEQMSKWAMCSIASYWSILAVNSSNVIQSGYNYRIGEFEIQTKLWGEGMIAETLLNKYWEKAMGMVKALKLYESFPQVPIYVIKRGEGKVPYNRDPNIFTTMTSMEAVTLKDSKSQYAIIMKIWG